MAVLIGTLLIAPLTVAEATPDPAAAEPHGELSLAQAVAATLARNPELQSTEYELQAAEARTLQAGLRPNPELGVDLENFAGSGDARLETTLRLSQIIELGQKRDHRVQVAQADRAATVVERQILQLDVLADVTRRFVGVVALQERLALVRRATELAERTLAAVTVRVNAARSPEAEKSRAAIALARARLELQRTEYTLQSERRALAALWGSTEPQFEIARADLYTMPPVENFDALERRLHDNPDLLSFAAEARLREAQLRLAQAQARPNLQFNAGVRRLQDPRNPDTYDTALVAGFTMSLPFFDRNQGAIREAQIRREQVPVKTQAAYLKANATLFEIYQELQQARSEALTLREQIIPQAQQALTQTDYGFQRGRFSYLELANAQLELIDLERAAIDAAAVHHRLIAEIERLTNEPLTSASMSDGATERGTHP